MYLASLIHFFFNYFPGLSLSAWIKCTFRLFCWYPCSLLDFSQDYEYPSAWQTCHFLWPFITVPHFPIGEECFVVLLWLYYKQIGVKISLALSELLSPADNDKAEHWMHTQK